MSAASSPTETSVNSTNPVRNDSIFFGHLRRFPATDAGMDDILYWSRERLGSKAVISVTHLVIEKMSERSPAAFVAASRQIYSSHFFDASLGLTILVPSPESSTATTLVYINRSRVDVFDGWLGRVKPALVGPRLRPAMVKFLLEARDRVEHPVTRDN